MLSFRGTQAQLMQSSSKATCTDTGISDSCHSRETKCHLALSCLALGATCKLMTQPYLCCHHKRLPQPFSVLKARRSPRPTHAFSIKDASVLVTIIQMMFPDGKPVGHLFISAFSFYVQTKIKDNDKPCFSQR